MGRKRFGEHEKRGGGVEGDEEFQTKEAGRKAPKTRVAEHRPREKASSYLDADLKRTLENLTFPPTFRGLHNPRARARLLPFLPLSIWETRLFPRVFTKKK